MTEAYSLGKVYMAYTNPIAPTNKQNRTKAPNMLKKVENRLFHHKAISNIGLELNASMQLANILFELDGPVGNDFNRVETKRVPGAALIEIDGSITFTELQDLYKFFSDNEITLESQPSACGILLIIRDTTASAEVAATLTHWLSWRATGVESIMKSDLMPNDKEDCIDDIHDIVVTALRA